MNSEMQLETKRKKYSKLVLNRKNCNLCDGLANPAKVCQGAYDSDEIGPWTAWHGNLNSNIVVIGQDWGDEDAFANQYGRINPQNTTNVNLVKLLKSIYAKEEELFFTNAILCLKQGGLAASTKNTWYSNCLNQFLIPLLEIIQPKIVITLGQKAYHTLAKYYGYPSLPLKEAIINKQPIPLFNNTVLFPVYHCGQLGLANRKFKQQVEDWKKIKEYKDSL